MNETEQSFREDTYAAQREELLSLIKTLAARNAPLVVHGEARLMPDDMSRLLAKLRNGYGFSRREAAALRDAGFELENIFPGR